MRVHLRTFMSKESGHMLSRAFTTVPILPGSDFGGPAARV